jgi:hypothetical protein
MRTSPSLLLLAALGACSSQRAVVPPSGEARPTPTLPFIEDDYARALADAKARGVPIFVDAWAPW